MVLKTPCSNQKINKKPRPLEVILLSMGFSENTSVLDYVISCSERFPEVAIIIRMKILEKGLQELIEQKVRNCRNVFLSIDYSSMAISYTLCQLADVIVSVQTSLAEECLNFGKKLIFLDNLYTVKNLSTGIYPKDFHFLIAKDSEEMNCMIQLIINGDECLLRKYERLREKLAGDYDLSEPNVIPKLLEKYLC